MRSLVHENEIIEQVKDVFPSTLQLKRLKNVKQYILDSVSPNNSAIFEPEHRATFEGKIQIDDAYSKIYGNEYQDIYSNVYVNNKGILTIISTLKDSQVGRVSDCDSFQTGTFQIARDLYEIVKIGIGDVYYLLNYLNSSNVVKSDLEYRKDKQSIYNLNIPMKAARIVKLSEKDIKDYENDISNILSFASSYKNANWQWIATSTINNINSPLQTEPFIIQEGLSMADNIKHGYQYIIKYGEKGVE